MTSSSSTVFCPLRLRCYFCVKICGKKVRVIREGNIRRIYRKVKECYDNDIQGGMKTVMKIGRGGGKRHWKGGRGEGDTGAPS